MATTGWLGTAFLLTYMFSAPVLGLLADRFSRWIIVGCAVLVWSVASGGSGLAATFGILLLTRVFVGIGEGGYGPAAPTILADLFPVEKRGRILAIFCAAIPVGSALGYVLGAAVGAHFGWRWAFYLVTPPGVLLGLLCFFQRDPRASQGERARDARAGLRDYVELVRTRSYLFNCLAQTAFTFAIGGLGFWVAAYLRYRGRPDAEKGYFGLILVVAGLGSTLIGGWVADKMRARYPGSYFLVSGVGMLLAFPFFVAALYIPFPLAWAFMFISIFFAFLNTGPSNTALANVSRPAVRATAFAMNILVIHLLGDAAAFPTIGYIGGHTNMNIAFLVVSGMMLLAGVLWIAGMKFLPADTAAVEEPAS
jgi:predicted MFS family arabinose efflux permease